MRTIRPSHILGLLCAMLLVGCTATVPINYAPSSVMSAEGKAQVLQFDYLPARDGKVKSNQVRNTAIGNILFEKDVAAFFRDAVFAELRFVGLKVGDQGPQLSGEIQEFLIDDLGYSVDWTLKVRYVVRDANNAVTFDAVKTVERNTNKFVNVFGALNETMKLNVEELLKDEGFRKAIR